MSRSFRRGICAASATIGVLLGAPASANPTSTCQELLTDEFFGTFGTVSAVQQTRDLQGPVSGYTYAPGGNSSEGQYVVTSDAWGSQSWNGLGQRVIGHTDGTTEDAYLLVNGSTSVGVFFEQSLDVARNKDFEVSAWFFNWTNAAFDTPGSRPTLALRIFDSTGTTLLGEAVQTDILADGNWHQAFAVVNSGNNDSIVVRAVNLSTQAGGNDFVMDDLSIKALTTPCVATDFSDAPISTTSYGSASHEIDPAIYMGADVTAEQTDFDSANADGDADDGVSLPILTQGQTATIPVTVAGAGAFLQAWIDWNDNGSFADAGEQIAINAQDGGAGDTDGVAGTISLSVPVPATASTTPTFARFRWSTSSGVGSGGLAIDGEVEDYALNVSASGGGGGGGASTFCEAQGYSLVGGNLIGGGSFTVQGDLASNISGATTGYTHYTGGGFVDGWPNDGNWEPDNGKYLITSRTGPVRYFQNFGSAWHDQVGVRNATDSTDKFMVVNGDLSAGDVFQLQVNVTAGVIYEFSAYVTNLISRDQGDIEPNVAFEYSTNGGASWDTLFETGNIPARTDAQGPLWEQQYGYVTPSATGTMLIRLNSIAPGGTGNDFAIDELVFQGCSGNPLSAGDPDYSDAPTSGTSYGDATHAIVGGVQLGAAIDGESASIANADASGDGADDDGVTLPALTRGQTATIPVSVSGAGGYLQAWIDWNDNGSFADAGEQIALDVQDGGAGDTDAVAGTISLSVPVPATASTDPTFARFRWSTTSGLGISGAASDGEVEDYQVTVAASYMPVCSAVATSGMSLAGTASLGGQGQIILTPNAGNQAGLAWSSGRINLNNPFSMEFSVYLGTNTEVGADGIGFAFHNDPAGSAAVGSFGGALGIGGLAPAVAIEFDTFDNNNSPFGPNPTFNDTTPNDHAVIYDPLNYSDGGGGGPASLIGSVVDLGELEDGAWHPVVVNWDPATNTLSYTVDGSAGDSVVRDMINTDFGGNPLVYYGFAAGTGAYTNEHQVCIEDAPAFADTDYSDAPIVYQDATHVIVSGVQLGAAIDGETASIASVDASGDGADDDGVTLPTLTLGLAGTVSVDVSGAGGYLQGWIDWNQDGDFADLGEELLTNVQDNGVGDSDLTVGTIGFTVTPALTTPPGTTFARFRWSITSGIGSTGVAGDGEVEDYEVTIQSSAGGGGSNGTLNYANSGTGANPGSLAILDWATSGLADGIRDGDTVNFALPSCRTGTLTATFSNVVNPANAETYLPTDLNTWAGASFAYSYNTAGTGEALYGGDNADTSFTIDWSMTVDGASVTPDIFVIDAESTNGAGEFLSATTNGGNWALIESAGGTDYVIAGTGTQTFTITKTENPSNSPLLLSENTTRTDIAIEAGGRQAVAFGVLLPCDYGDANVAGSPSHAFWQRPDAGGGLTFDDTLYLGSTPPDAETGPRPTADASGDDVDALGDDEDGVSSFPTLTEGDTSYTLPRASITANGTGTIHAWIDFNGDGTFASTEYAQTAVSGGVVAQNLYWKDQTTMSAGTTFARLRFTSDGAINASTPGGAASDGEVEDYRVTVSSEPFVAGASLCTAPLPTGLPLDVSGLSGSGGYFDRNTAGDAVVGVTASGLSTVGGNGTETVVNGATSEVIRFQANPFVHGSRATQSWTFDRQTGIDLAAGSAYGAPDSNMNRSFDRLVFRAYGTTAGFSWVMNSSLNGSYTISADGRTLAIEADAGNTAADFTQFDVSTSGALTRLDITKESEIGGSFLDSTQFAMTVPACDVDLSDAPVSYGEARHQTGNGTRLGAAVDGETASIASTNADGDGADDDGVSFGTLNIGESGTITVSVTGPGYLNAWIDLDGSGAFDSPAEQIATDLVDYDADGTIPLALDIPAWATTGQTFARFRWSADFGIQATGAAADGEVEDYALTFGAAGTGGTRLSGTIFEDNGPGTAHDGIINAGEATGQFASVSILLAADSSLVAVGSVNPDGSWEAVLPEGFSSEIRVVASPAIGYLSASEAPGALPGLNNPSATDGAVVFTPVANSTYPGIDFGLIQTPILTQNQTGVVGAGQIIELPHVYTATSDGSVTFALVDETSTPAGAFSSLILSDTDCNGSGDAIQSGAVAVSAGQQICLVVRTQAGGGVGDASSHLYGIVATTAFTGTDILSSLRNDDRLGSSSRSVLHLEKLVRNLTAGTPEGRSNTGSPNDILEYRLVLMNPTGEAASNVRVTDATPAFTTLSSPVSSPVAVVPGMTCTLTAPSGGANVAGYAGTISWTCPGTFPAGETGNLIFRVRISP